MKTISVKELKFTSKSAMANEITAEVNAYFNEKNISKKGNWKLFSKAIFFFLGFWTNYYFLIFSDLPVFVKAILCISLVFFASGIGFCIMHDGNHGSFSKKEWINKIAGKSSDSLGANSHIWVTKHNIIHHSGTNVNHVDDDIEARPLLCLHDDQPRYLIHRYQYLYWPIAYGLLYFLWVLFKDFLKYFTQKVMGEKVYFKTWDHINFWASKVFFYFLFIHIPINKVGFNAWFLGFMIFGSLLGLVLSTIFQLAHIVRGLKHPSFGEAKGSERFEHQISTTANFAPQNKFIAWWVGGLNFQIEHHLFPKISHVHYPEIHKIIKRVCEKYNFPLLVFPSFGLALESHIGKLKDLGKNPK
ncbi:acyl-CoA desaturase [Candidatus Nomurabacteria bacterium]|nr:acyl-CoA desaturase [Candidatus Nomurabacteria bacterium]